MATKKNSDTNLVIVNHQPTMIELPTINGSAKQLLPGENDVPKTLWEQAKKNPAVKMWIACKYLEDKGPGRAKTLVKGLDALSDEKAKDQIDRCSDIELLQQWKSSSNKVQVRKAIDARIEDLIAEAGGPDDDNTNSPVGA